MSEAPLDDANESWDLFCRVVDNFGDIGIAWRLARQLARSPATGSPRRVRLIVEGLDVFARIEPRIAVNADRQWLDEIEVLRWPVAPTVPSIERVASVVIEMLGCGLPPAYVDALVGRRGRVAWIDFEHLSAEAWVDGFHALPSPHPTLPLVKHFWYPGFGSRTGGLLVEPDLAERRRSFVGNRPEVDALWRRLDLSTPRADETRVSLFAYPDAPVEALLATMAADEGGRWSVVVPQGVLSSRVDAFFGGAADERRRTRGSLQVSRIPFVDQDEYDRLLWACDLNFVRGEDSFVRAQAAGRPFVWQIYRQADDAHLPKLAAFEERYASGLPPDARQAEHDFLSFWNGAEIHGADRVAAWLQALPALRSHAESWRRRLEGESPLIDRLLAFVAAIRAGG